jgi:endogenous inhibitor of DNA gyrase (YacG/DUF329 family)
MNESKCPTCGKPVAGSSHTSSFLPFCSSRCKQADLGKWMTGYYQISRPLDLDTDFQETELEENDQPSH